MREILEIISGVLFFAGYLPYYLGIVRGNTKPQVVTWLIWSAIDWLTLIGMFVSGSVNGLIIGATAGATIAMFLAWFYGPKVRFSRFDLVCLVGAASAIVLWRVFDDAVLGIICCQVVNLIGALPTWRSVWRDPSVEEKLPWLMFWTSCVLSVMAIPSWSPAAWLPPVTFLVIQSVVVVLLLVPTKQHS